MSCCRVCGDAEQTWMDMRGLCFRCREWFGASLVRLLPKSIAYRGYTYAHHWDDPPPPVTATKEEPRS